MSENQTRQANQKERLIRGALIAGSSLLALLFAEIFCALFLPSHIVDNDIFGRKMVEGGMKYEIPSDCLDFVPSQTGRHRVHGSYDYAFEIDSRRMRVLPNPPTDAKQNILVLGDSQTFGMGLPADQTFSYLLQEELRAQGRNVRVFNAGVPGQATASEICKLSRLGPQVKPKLVLVGFFAYPTLDYDEGNDLYGNKPASSAPSPGVPASRKPKIPFLSHSSHFYSALSAIYHRAKSRPQSFEDRVAYYRDRPELKAAWEESRRLLKNLDATASSLGARLVVIHLPHVESLKIADHSVLDELRKSDLPVISLSPVLAQLWKGKNENVVLPDGHFNAPANAAIARELAARLQDSTLLDDPTRSVASPRVRK